MRYPDYNVSAPTRREKLILRILIVVGVCCLFRFLYFFFLPEYRGFWPLFLLLAIVVIYGSLKQLYLWYHYFDISVPKSPILSEQKTVDVLTTYFPGEPYEMILETLEAIQNMPYPHTTYLCDEANDDFLKERCRSMGVIHVTRNDRKNAKAGNINNALKIAKGEICLILDPDHIPKEDFLDTVLPYFEDKSIGFVQVVQAYYNKPHTLVARGAAEQTFQFYGPLMMTMNSYGTVNAIGANCTFRRSALDSIDGHAPGLAEDMHTAMLLHAKGWKSVYVPKMVAKGLAPADLTSYFKQQLKWSRGTFELLYKVYPKQFSKFTTRQKLHYGLLPLHYLIGFVYLINFLIPILALFSSKMPWTGDVLKFAWIGLPLFASSLLIGVYVQKWVIEKGDRGFHVIGGLLQISAWWVFLVGVVYTFVRKKVPYLPTPKREGDGTNFMLLVPNLLIAALSLFAIIFGLSQNMTPYSLVMAFFAFLNILFMLFSFYLGWKVTNKNQILRKRLTDQTIHGLKKIKYWVILAADKIFESVRYAVVLILAACLYLSFTYEDKFENELWDQTFTLMDKPMETIAFLGIYQPFAAGGLSNLEEVGKIESRDGIGLNLISIYEAWGDETEYSVSEKYLQNIIDRGKVPLLTWEPWTTNFSIPDSLPELKNSEKVLKYISQGFFDGYIREKAKELSQFKSPIFLRFAHEFDNPSYPWSISGKNTPLDFVMAWKHVHKLFKEEGASNVVWVWSPWRSEAMQGYYPGDEYVDWIGLDILNYGILNQDRTWYPFTSLYKPFHDELKKITKKPVMLAEFGSLALGGDRDLWIKNALVSIRNRFTEIKGVVFFNSRYDRNIPEKANFDESFLDWTVASLDQKNMPYPTIELSFFNNSEEKGEGKAPYVPITISENYKGVYYYKAQNWKNNSYVANKWELLQDFRLMKASGINCIQTKYSKIYAHNLIKYSSEKDIRLIYDLQLPSTMQFLDNTVESAKIKRNILDIVSSHKNDSSILAWHIANPLAKNSQTNLDRASQMIYRNLYGIWLRELTDAIKEKDASKAVFLDIPLTTNTKEDVVYLSGENLRIDGYSLGLNEDVDPEPILQFFKTLKTNLIVKDVDSTTLPHHRKIIEEHSFILSNWQHRMETHNITFDGLLDHNGNKTKAYVHANNLLRKENLSFDLPEIKIMKPAIPLLPSTMVTYYAYYKSNGKWVRPSGQVTQEYSWLLAKTDDNDNVVALKELGKGSSMNLEVPQKYGDYKLVLIVEENGYSNMEITTLNTPLY